MLHYETVEPDTLELLRRLMDKTYLSTFCLVGGTSLSLQFGHRKSIDLDLFSETDFDGTKLLENLEQDFQQIDVLTKTKGTLLTRVALLHESQPPRPMLPNRRTRAYFGMN